MADTSLPKSHPLYPRKIPVTRKDGTRGYLRKTYVCDHCSCNSQQQAQCVFMRENVLGLMAGFSPDPRYRKRHTDDIAGSPLMQSFKYRKPIDNGVALDSMVLPPVKFPHFPVKSWNSMMETLNRMKVIRKRIGVG